MYTYMSGFVFFDNEDRLLGIHCLIMVDLDVDVEGVLVLVLGGRIAGRGRGQLSGLRELNLGFGIRDAWGW